MSSASVSSFREFRLYDTLRGELCLFEPMDAKDIKLYVCGPTVYDDAHLGHARCYITWDILFRHLKTLGHPVRYVRNVTDVDDKIITRAKRENTLPKEIAARYFERFEEDMAALNVSAPSKQPKATEHIQVMFDAISALIEKGAAYIVPNGTVYFRTAISTDYGKLSKKPLDELKAGARVELDPSKESPLDFALWKSTKPDDPYTWESPWGKGRPGWHIECSAMNYAEFGSHIDIHAGGADLIFPHHENEIAQSECWSGDKPFSKYWMHNGFVNVSGEKMSKSLGNFSTIRKVLERYDANVIRYFLLQHHYRMPVDFNDEALDGAKNRIRKIYRIFKRTLQLLSMSHEAFLAQASNANDLADAYFEAMSDDLNTPKALALFNQAIGQLEQALSENKVDDAKQAFTDALTIWDALGFRKDLATQEDTLPLVLLLKLAEAQSVDIPKQEPQVILESLIEARKLAKQNKNWSVADAIRNELTAMGIQLMDNKDGTTTFEMI